MKKLFINLAVFALIAIGLLYAYDRTAITVEHVGIRQLEEGFNQLPDAHYVSLGNSQGKRLKLGFGDNPEMTNLCINGNDLFIVHEQLTNIKKALNENKVVLVNISLFSMEYIIDTFEQDMSENLRKFYYAMPVNYFNLLHAGKYVKSKTYVVNRINNLDRLLKKIAGARPIEDDDQTDAENIDIVPLKDTMRQRDSDEDLTRWTTAAKKHNDIRRNSIRYMPDIKERCIEEAKAIRKIVDEKGARLIFYSTPHIHHYIKEYGKLSVDSASNSLSETFKDLGIEYYNHLSDEEFIYDADNFKDGDHLNEKGAQKFTAKLLNEAGLIK